MPRNKRGIAWTAENLQYLKDNYLTMSCEALGKHFGIQELSIRTKVSRMRQAGEFTAYKTLPIGAESDRIEYGKAVKYVKTVDGWRRKRKEKVPKPPKVKVVRVKVVKPPKPVKVKVPKPAKVKPVKIKVPKPRVTKPVKPVVTARPKRGKSQQAMADRKAVQAMRKVRTVKIPDNSGKVSVRIDHKTVIMCLPEHVEAIKAKYKLTA